MRLYSLSQKDRRCFRSDGLSTLINPVRMALKQCVLLS